MKQLFGLLVVTFGIVLMPALPIQAVASRQLDIKINVEVSETRSTEVSYTISGTNKETQQEVVIPLVGRGLSGVAVKIDGATQTPALEEATLSKGPFAVGYTALSLKLPSSLQSKDSKWTTTVNYKTEDLIADSHLATFAIPALPYEADNLSEVIEVTIPLSRGLPVAIGLEPNDSVAGDGKQTYSFKNDKQPRSQSILFDFATKADYGLKWQQELKNTGWWWKTFQVVLAPDTNQQIISLTTITPKPTSIRLDRDGNILLNYRLRPKKTIKVEASGQAHVRSLSYSIDEKRPASEVPSTLSGYTEGKGVWSGGTSADGESAAAKLGNMYNEALGQAADSVPDNYVDVVNRLIANARASGLPARLIAGVLSHNGAQAVAESMVHIWAEVYLPGTGWMTIDPAVGLFYDQVGLVDAYRVGEVIRGLNPDEPKRNPKAVNLTSLPAVAEEGTGEEPELPNPTLRQTKYLLLPGISFVQTNVSMPAGRVIDSLAYTDRGQTRKLGSLAPFQTIEHWSLAFAGDSWSQAEVAIGTLNSEGIDTLSTVKSKLSFIGIIVVFTLVGAAVAGILWWRKRSTKAIKLNNADEDPKIPAEELLRRDNSNPADLGR